MRRSGSGGCTMHEQTADTLCHHQPSDSASADWGLRWLAALLLTVWLSRVRPAVCSVGLHVAGWRSGAVTPSCSRSVLTLGGECGRHSGHSTGP